MPTISFTLLAIALGAGASCSDGGSASPADAATAGADAVLFTADAASVTASDAAPGAAPRVTGTIPADLATGIEQDATLEATFSKDMAAGTMVASTFFVSVNGARVSGTVTYDAAIRVASFHPSAPLAIFGTYTATMTTGMTDVGGTPLAAERSWTFTIRDGSWGAPQAVDSTESSVDGPHIAIDPAGNASAVWRQEGGIAVDRSTAAEWGVATLLDAPGGEFAEGQRVAVDRAGNASAVWIQSAGGRAQVWAARYLSGTGWGTAAPVDPSVAGQAGYRPQVAVDAAGVTTVVWDQSPGNDHTLARIRARRYVPGSGWEASEVIDTGNIGGARSPQVSAGASGVLFAVWTQSDTSGEIWANRFLPGSGWGTAAPLETTTVGYASVPQVAVDAAGNAVAVWMRHDGTRFNIWSSRFVAGSAWDAARLLENDDNVALDPRVAVDPSGNATAVWQQSDGTRSNVWARRFVPGAGWGAATLLETSDLSAMGPQVAVADSGIATVVWPQSDGTQLDLWTTRFVPGAGWGTAGLLGTNRAGDTYGVQLAVAPTGYAMAVWQQTTGVARSGSHWDAWAIDFR